MSWRGRKAAARTPTFALGPSGELVSSSPTQRTEEEQANATRMMDPDGVSTVAAPDSPSLAIAHFPSTMEPTERIAQEGGTSLAVDTAQETVEETLQDELQDRMQETLQDTLQDTHRNYDSSHIDNNLYYDGEGHVDTSHSTMYPTHGHTILYDDYDEDTEDTEGGGGYLSMPHDRSFHNAGRLDESMPGLDDPTATGTSHSDESEQLVRGSNAPGPAGLTKPRVQFPGDVEYQSLKDAHRNGTMEQSATTHPRAGQCNMCIAVALTVIAITLILQLVMDRVCGVDACFDSNQSATRNFLDPPVASTPVAAAPAVTAAPMVSRNIFDPSPTATPTLRIRAVTTVAPSDRIVTTVPSDVPTVVPTTSPTTTVPPTTLEPTVVTEIPTAPPNLVLEIESVSPVNIMGTVQPTVPGDGNGTSASVVPTASLVPTSGPTTGGATVAEPSPSGKKTKVPTSVPMPTTPPLAVAPTAVAGTGSKPNQTRSNAIVSFINSISLSNRTIALPNATSTSPTPAPTSLANRPPAEDLALQWLIDEDPLQLVPDTDAAKFRLTQRYALLSMWFQPLPDEEVWVNVFGWLIPDEECKWYGITCVETDLRGDVGLQQEVTGINMDANNLHGTISSELGLLTHLETFSMTGNVLQGTIPDAVGAWTRLTYLSVQTNELTGTIPLSINNWTGIVYLYWDSNLLTGTVPRDLCKIASESLYYQVADCPAEIICVCCNNCPY